MLDDFLKKGWCQFALDPAIKEWINVALPAARKAVAKTENAEWFRYQNTWFAGVNVLPNDMNGSIGGNLPLQGNAIDFVRDQLGLTSFEWDKAQISVCYPGYPKPGPGESVGMFQFRLKRDAAHVDGLLREGKLRRRYLREHHGFILGIPLVEYSSDASPPVVWEGSQDIVRNRFQRHFEHKPSENWHDIDVTDVYHETRQAIFQQCTRVAIHAKPGEAYLIHRLALHGMAPWKDGATAAKDGRMICYFRPYISDPTDWLNAL